MKLEIFFRYLIIGAFLSGCSAKSSVETSHGQIQGLADFGAIILGDRIESLYRLDNSDGSTEAPVELSLASPFFLVSASPAGCEAERIPAGASCLFRLRFAPDTKGTYALSIKFRGETLKFAGQGITPGILQLAQSQFDLGTIRAGETHPVVLALKNTGDSPLPYPQLSLPADVKLLSTSCDQVILSQGSCAISLTVSPTVRAPVYGRLVGLDSGASAASVQITGTVQADASSGLISFTLDPQKNQVGRNDNLPITVKTNPIMDRYGNIVEDGTEIRVITSNLTLDGHAAGEVQTYLTQDGTITFVVRAKDQPSDALSAGFSAQTSTSFGSYSFTIKNN